MFDMRRLLRIVESAEAPRIEPFQKSDGEALMRAAVALFGQHMPPRALESYLLAATDWTISRKATVNGEFAGFYLLRPASIFDLVEPENALLDLTPYEGKSGVEGVALGVLPEYRGTGVGRRLMDLPRDLGFDYVFGQHLDTLNNLNHWLKRRRLAASSGGLHITISDLMH